MEDRSWKKDGLINKGFTEEIQLVSNCSPVNLVNYGHL